MQQLGAGYSWRDWSGDFKANATLKDFGSALEEMPVAAAGAMVGGEKDAWDEKVKKAQAALSLLHFGGPRVQGYSTGCSYSKGSMASTGAGVPGGEQSKEKGHADSLVKHRCQERRGGTRSSRKGTGVLCTGEADSQRDG